MKTERKFVTLFHETFSSRTDSLPGGWYVERNHDMPQVPGIRCGEKCIEILSAGNKFLPVIPDVADCHVKFKAGVNFSVSEILGIFLCFRYDTFSGSGQAVRLGALAKDKTTVVEYGCMRNNHFTAENSKSLKINQDIFNSPFDVELNITGQNLTVNVAGKSVKFNVKDGKGKIALSRQHFFDILKIFSFDIEGEQPSSRRKDVRFTVPMPDCHTYYPIYCDVTLKDYGNCMDAGLSFRGGVYDTPVGEGNYHGRRVDAIERPYLKILTAETSEKHIMHDKTIVLVPAGSESKYLYTFMYEKQQWPFCRTIRFMKPDIPFDLAVGFEEYQQTSLPGMELDPAETVFNAKGKVLYSGLGITRNEKTKVEFLSQEDKAILKKLPKTDPRYDRAVKFAKENHYFIGKEVPQFRIRLSSSSPLPVQYNVTLEDAFLRPVRTLKFKQNCKEELLGVSRISVVELVVESLKKLKCGVWHLRVSSADPSVPSLENYCAFEIMNDSKDTPCAPLLSGLPFLYSARTETRGLMTDAFDPWIGASVDDGHYIACSVMLPEAYRKYKMADTIHAYQRKNFAWISSRTLNDWAIEHNLDILKTTDYANIQDCADRMDYSWAHSYRNHRLQLLIEFLKTVKDLRFDIPALQKLQKEGGTLSAEDYRYMTENYWEEWLDYINDYTAKEVKKTLVELRKLNPELKLAQYGPFHIYAGCMKGPECARWIANGKLTPDLNAFWQFEDYPFSCGYNLERGLYTMTSCLMALPGSCIYPEIYTGGKLKGFCPDGAVFFAHPPFGGKEGINPENMFVRQIANFSYATGHMEKDGFHFWDNPGFQACRFTRQWYEKLLHFWPVVLAHPAERPLCSAAYVSSKDSCRANRKNFLEDYNQIRCTAPENVPAIYEAATTHGLCAGFQVFDTDLKKIDAEQTDTLVLPPTKGMSREVLKTIRRLHAQGVNLVACENVVGLEDLFGVKDTGKMKTVTKVRATGDFCSGMSEFCTNERCQGSYKADGAEILLNAEIPVLTIKRNGKAGAAFFNVPPHMVKPDVLHERFSYGKGNISPLMERAMTELMKRFSRTGISVTAGRLIACRTKDHGILAVVSNPDDKRDLVTEITIRKMPGLTGEPETSLDLVLIREDHASRTWRVSLPKGELVTIFFKDSRKRTSRETLDSQQIHSETVFP